MPSKTLESMSAHSSDVASDLPVLDYGKLYGSPEEKKSALKQLDEAFGTYGFVYLGNHTIPQAMVDEAFDWVCLAFLQGTRTQPYTMTN
jgi:isopenicillin N synthase-like dioxygenase